MIKISKDKIKTIVKVPNGREVYGINLEDMEWSGLEKLDIFEKLRSDLRSTIRAHENLNESVRVIIELQKYHTSSGYPQPGKSLVAESLFSHAVTLYRACFVKGENNKYPLGFLYDDIKDHDLHKKIMTLAHRYFAHLDENVEVRMDFITWEFELKEAQLVPNKPNLNWSRFRAFHVGTLKDWVSFIEKLCEKIKSREKKLIIEFNELVGIVLYK